MKLRILVAVIVLAFLGGAAWTTVHLVRAASTSSSTEVPTTRVKRGTVVVSVAARGELQGGNTEMLVAPMTGNDSLAITYLRDPGELVQPGDVVVQFDTTQQEYNLREAEADLAEAEQQVIAAKATDDATAEESAYTLTSTASDVKLAELEVRKNPILPNITARQNLIALEQAQNRRRQAEQDIKNKKSNTEAAVAIQQAAYNKAKVAADTARKVIDSMTLRSKSAGYVSIQNNTSNLMVIYTGMTLQAFQVGDTARPGLAVAQIPNLKTWEVSAQIGELDRGHLNPGQSVAVNVVALPNKSFPGHVKSIGGVSGSPWDRHFECRIVLDHPAPELRPGETTNMVIEIEKLQNVTWIPSQALFESDSRKFVYMQTKQGFLAHDVNLVRSSESQAVITGIDEGALIAMSNPNQQNKATSQGQGAMKALQK